MISDELKKKFLEIFALSVALGASFLVINFLHFKYISVSVILYACLWDAAIATLLVMAGFIALRGGRSHLLPTETILTAISSNLLIIVYSIMGPTVIDRSLSLYIVNKIDQRGGEVREEAMSDIFIYEYLPEFRLVDVRMTEQVTSGTVEIKDGCIYLTDKGRIISQFANWYRANFLPQKRNLMGEVTDQLTDPFKDSKAIVQSDCT